MSPGLVGGQAHRTQRSLDFDARPESHPLRASSCSSTQPMSQMTATVARPERANANLATSRWISVVKWLCTLVLDVLKATGHLLVVGQEVAQRGVEHRSWNVPHSAGGCLDVYKRASSPVLPAHMISMQQRGSAAHPG